MSEKQKYRCTMPMKDRDEQEQETLTVPSRWLLKMSEKQKYRCTMPMKERDEQEQETPTVPSRKRNSLAAMIVEDATAGSRDREEGNKGAKDWVLSYEGVKVKKAEENRNKLQLNKRQYSRSNSEVITFSNEAIAGPVNTVNQNSTHNEPVPAFVNNRYLLIQDLLNQARSLTDAISLIKIFSKILKTVKAHVNDRSIPLQPIENMETEEQIVHIAPNLKTDDGLKASSGQSNQFLNEAQDQNNINENKENNTDDAVHVRISCAKRMPNNEAVEQEWVPIGSGMTLVDAKKYKKINWKSYTIATRTLLMAVFSRRVLATHSLTGKPSPAFPGKPAKMSLDSKKVSDVIAEIVDRFNVRENFVRSIITTKCADECKMWKTRCNKNTLKSKETTDTV